MIQTSRHEIETAMNAKNVIDVLDLDASTAITSNRSNNYDAQNDRFRVPIKYRKLIKHKKRLNWIIRNCCKYLQKNAIIFMSFKTQP